MPKRAQSRVIAYQWQQIAWRAGVSIVFLLAAFNYALAGEADKAADAGQLETGAIERDARVAPVRRVFPKTPTDRELSRLSASVSGKKSASKSAKR